MLQKPKESKRQNAWPVRFGHHFTQAVRAYFKYPIVYCTFLAALLKALALKQNFAKILFP